MAILRLPMALASPVRRWQTHLDNFSAGVSRAQVNDCASHLHFTQQFRSPRSHTPPGMAAVLVTVLAVLAVYGARIRWQLVLTQQLLPAPHPHTRGRDPAELNGVPGKDGERGENSIEILCGELPPHALTLDAPVLLRARTSF